MASKKTDDALHAIAKFSDKLSSISKPEAQKLDEWLRELRIAAEDERDAAASTVDEANVRVHAVNLELEMAKDQNEKLIKEVQHLEGEVNKLRRREKERDAGRGRQRRNAANKEITSKTNEQKILSRTSETLKTTSRINEPTKAIASAPTGPAAQRHRVDSVLDPRFPAASAACTAPPQTATASTRPSARGYDSYVPSFKRARVDSDSPARSTAVASTHGRRAVCGSCKENGKDDSCDGKAECNRCVRYGSRCAYWRCDQRSGCTDAACTWLHPHQWDEVAEGRKRAIR